MSGTASAAASLTLDSDLSFDLQYRDALIRSLMEYSCRRQLIVQLAGNGNKVRIIF
jgi:hypothetical protein